MKRLTYRDETGKAYIKIPTGLTFIAEGEMVISAIQKLAHYEDLEEKNRPLREKANEYKKQTGYDKATIEERKAMADSFIEGLESIKLEK